MDIMAKKKLFTVISRIIENLDISKSQYETAKDRYNAIGNWLAKGEYCLTNGSRICLKNGEIYPQGSIKLGTTVKPIGQEEFDVDLVFFTPNILPTDIEPKELNRLIGNRLREHNVYKNMLSPLKRGWRITYADEFHLDITPSINNHTEKNNSEFVPDRKNQDWKPSNPKDYAQWFDKSAQLMPNFYYSQRSDILIAKTEHQVTDFPEQNHIKPLLKIYVQILKRHRDIMFKDKKHKPISIIITTLATHAYNWCIKNKEYNNEIDLLIDVIKMMPKFIQGYQGNYQILNPTTQFENFAERWNEVPSKKQAFDNWHKNILSFFTSIEQLSGQHIIFRKLEEGFGRDNVEKIYAEATNNIEDSRKNGLLNLGTGSIAKDIPVKKNTFFGK